MTFTVTQTESLLTASSVSAQTADGTALVAGPAVGGSDYEATSGTVTIPFGATTGTFTVLVKGDEIYEHDDAYTVGLTAPDNLTIGDASATGTISNDEATPRLVAGNLGVVEKDTGATTNGNVPVTLTPVLGVPDHRRLEHRRGQRLRVRLQHRRRHPDLRSRPRQPQRRGPGRRRPRDRGRRDGAGQPVEPDPSR